MIFERNVNSANATLTRSISALSSSASYVSIESGASRLRKREGAGEGVVTHEEEGRYSGTQRKSQDTQQVLPFCGA